MSGKLGSMSDTVQIEDALSVEAQKQQPLYAGRVKIYSKEAHGRFRTVKWIVMAVTLGIYDLLPWIRWDRGPTAPDQAVLVDMPGRRFYFFFIEIWPQEIYYLTFLLMAAAFGLFLATAIGGRVWCGFACPQTVWTDLFIWVERKIQGEDIVATPTEEPKAQVIDLMEALKASLGEASAPKDEDEAATG